MQLTHKHGFRSIYALTVHVVFVTKYRRKVISAAMMLRLREIFEETCDKWECQLVEFNGEADHVHLLINFSPQVQLSKLIANLKTVSSRLLRKDFKVELERVYSKPVLWTGSYFVASCGGVTIETLRKYVEGQASRES
ncbi:MAG: IS200/IS605 family transposase [Gloeocapsa sp. UFS-A4-WI-NPMV-4B04]|jgi:putative transposase|nr:IS200/IS605 family transposase [Gloeocapsa sp. UFS-A4-WI-NPMV-4B04]